MVKFWTFLIGYFLGNISLLVNGCTLPTDLTGAWDSSSKGTLYFNSTAMWNYKVYDRGNLEFECIINNGSNYVFRSQSFTFYSSVAEAVVCMKLESIKTSMYRYTLYTTQLQHADYERVKYVATTATVTETDACDDTTNTEVILLVADGALSSITTQCPDTFLGTFSYSLDDNTDCINKTGSLDVCTDLTTMTFNYSYCSTMMSYSSGGSVQCVYYSTSGTVTQLYVYNNDNTTDESTTYRFTCFMLESSGGLVYATQYPQTCPSTQNSTYVASPGKSLEMLASVPTTTTSAAATSVAAASLGIVAAAAVIGLILIVVGILVSIFIYKKKKKQVDPRIADKGLPPTDTGMVGCLEEVDVTDEVNAVLISGYGKSKTEKITIPSHIPIERQISLLDSLKSKIFKNSVHPIDRNITDEDKEVLKEKDIKKLFKPKIPCFEVPNVKNENNIGCNNFPEARPSTSRPLSTRIHRGKIDNITPRNDSLPSSPDCVIEEMDNLNEDQDVLVIAPPSKRSFVSDRTSINLSRPQPSDHDVISVPNINSYEGDAFEDDDSKIASKAILSNLNPRSLTPVENFTSNLRLKKVENVLDFLKQAPADITDIGDSSDEKPEDAIAMTNTWQEDFDLSQPPVVKKKQRRKKNISKITKKRKTAIAPISETKNSISDDNKIKNVIVIPSVDTDESKIENFGGHVEADKIIHESDDQKLNVGQPSSSKDLSDHHITNDTDYTNGSDDNMSLENHLPIASTSFANIGMGISDDKKLSSNSLNHLESDNEANDEIMSDRNKFENMEIGNITLKSLDSADLFGNLNATKAPSPNFQGNCDIDSNLNEKESQGDLSDNFEKEITHDINVPLPLKRDETNLDFDYLQYEKETFESSVSSSLESSSSSPSSDNDDDDKHNDDMVDEDDKIKQIPDSNVLDIQADKTDDDKHVFPKKKRKRRTERSKKRRKKKKSERNRSKAFGKESPLLDMARFFREEDRAGLTERPDDGIQGLILKIKETGVPEISSDGHDIPASANSSSDYQITSDNSKTMFVREMPENEF